MLETVKNIINCDLCNDLLEQPVILPCGGALFKRKRVSECCQLCDKNHDLSELDHFPANKKVARLLEAEISKLDFGENYKQATKLLHELNNASLNNEKAKHKAADLISEKFKGMIRKVNLIREEIIQKVNDCSEKIIANIDSYEKECKLNLRDLDSKLKSSKAFDLSRIRGETICAKHEELFRKNETTKCSFCDEDHKLSESGHFPTNKKVERFLRGEISKLDFGESFKKATKHLGELNNINLDCEEIKSKAEDLIITGISTTRRTIRLWFK
jgi:hypothetical protein